MRPPTRQHSSPDSRLPPSDYGTTLGSIALVFGLLVAVAIGGPILSAAVGAFGAVFADVSPSELAVLAGVVLLVAISLVVSISVVRQSRRVIVRWIGRRGVRSDTAPVSEEVGRPPR